MATYVTPEETHDHYVERDGGMGAGIWAVLAVLIVLFALLFFGSNLFGRNNSDSKDINIKGTIQTPSNSTGGTTTPTPSQ